MRDHVDSRYQLLGLRRLAKHSLADVTCRQVWSAGIGRERSRPRGRRGGKHQHTAAAHRSADRHLVTVLPQHVDAAAASSSSSQCLLQDGIEDLPSLHPVVAAN